LAFINFFLPKLVDLLKKNFTLSESSSGYVWDLDVYTGKTGQDPQKRLAHHVVRKLVQDLEGKGLNLFVDVLKPTTVSRFGGSDNFTLWNCAH